MQSITITVYELAKYLDQTARQCIMISQIYTVNGTEHCTLASTFYAYLVVQDTRMSKNKVHEHGE